MKHLFIALSFLVALITADAHADQLYVGGNSLHLPSAYATNQKHDFLAIEHDDYVAGSFINSYGTRTRIAGYKLHIDDLSSQYWQVSVVPSLTYGYHVCGAGDMPNASKKVCPAMPIEIQYTKYPIVPTILVLPQAVVLLFSIKF